MYIGPILDHRLKEIFLKGCPLYSLLCVSVCLSARGLPITVEDHEKETFYLVFFEIFIFTAFYWHFSLYSRRQKKLYTSLNRRKMKSDKDRITL